MKPPQLFSPEDFQHFCHCQLWRDLYDRQHFADSFGGAFDISAEAQAKFEEWFRKNCFVPNSRSHMKRVIVQTEATKMNPETEGDGS